MKSFGFLKFIRFIFLFRYGALLLVVLVFLVSVFVGLRRRFFLERFRDWCLGEGVVVY